MVKHILETERAMKPIRPYYAQGVKVSKGSLIFVSGQTWDPVKGPLEGRGDAKVQSREALEAVKNTLAAGGAAMKDVVKVTVYVRNIEDVDKIAEARYEYFKDSVPASTLVEVSKLWHEDVLLEIDAIAVVED